MLVFLLRQLNYKELNKSSQNFDKRPHRGADFSRGRECNISLLIRFLGSVHVILRNFMPIGQTIAEIWRFFDSSRWRPSAILDFQKFERNLNCRHGSEGQHASP